MRGAAPTACDVVARAVIEASVAPQAAAGVAVRLANGRWTREVGGDRATFFDLASLTKPMTAISVVASGIDREEVLGSLLQEARGTTSENASIERLLAHRAGLPPHIALWEPLLTGIAIDPREAIVAAANARTSDETALYSDLGYILAGLALARHTRSIDAGDAIRKFVSAPLGIEDTLGTSRDLEARGIDLRNGSAPTEIAEWRSGEVRGLVHDENAWALTGRGGSGHAGMFGTADAVLTFGCAVLDALDQHSPFGHFLDVSWLVADRHDGSTLRAGFDGKSHEASSAGERFGEKSFGHLGFTGTSLWIDPEAKIVATLLTNRVHPTRANVAIRAARPIAHDALFDLAIALRETCA
jgi:CubicO group peptidase (beta-lactamase class C family)